MAARRLFSDDFSCGFSKIWVVFLVFFSVVMIVFEVGLDLVGVLAIDDKMNENFVHSKLCW